MSDRDVLSESGREGAERIERILSTSSARELRGLVVDRLDPQAGESVLSIGCGPGFEPAALAAAVGERGRVHGVDVSEVTLALAEQRCDDLPRVTFARGDATALPVADGSYDAAVAKQVYQFVDDIEAALRELHRVLEPGGRAAIVEGDVDAQVVHSSDRDRTKRVQEAYLDVVPTPHLGSRLVSLLPGAGLTVERIEPKPNLHREINERVERGIEARRGILEANESFDRSEIEAWERDLRDLDEAGEFLTGGIQFVYIARKPE